MDITIKNKSRTYKNEFGCATVEVYDNLACVVYFEIYHKRCGHGKKMFYFLLNDLALNNIKNIEIISNNSIEAFSFWTAMTNVLYNDSAYCHKFKVNDLLYNKVSFSDNIKKFIHKIKL